MSKKVIPVYLSDVEIAGFLYQVEETISVGADLEPETLQKAKSLRDRLDVALGSFANPDEWEADLDRFTVFILRKDLEAISQIVTERFEQTKTEDPVWPYLRYLDQKLRGTLKDGPF